MSGTLAVALILGGVPTATLYRAAEIQLPSRTVRVGDIARVSGADAATRNRVASRILARLPAGQDTAALRRRALAGLLRRTVPELKVVGALEGPDVLIHAAAPRPPQSRPCLALARPLAKGEQLNLNDTKIVACDPSQAEAAVRFHRGGLSVAGRDLPAASYLGRLMLPQGLGAAAGERLTLRSLVGPVAIEREVVALQAGRPGRRIFVRSGDGQTLAARLSLLTEETR